MNKEGRSPGLLGFKQSLAAVAAAMGGEEKLRERLEGLGGVLGG